MDLKPNQTAPFILILLAAGFFIGVAQADEIGSPATLACSVTLTYPGGYSGLTSQGADVDRTGNLYLAEEWNVGVGTTSRITKFSPSCATIWAYTTGGTTDNPDAYGCTGTSGTNFCRISGLAADAAGDLVFGMQLTRTPAPAGHAQQEVFALKASGSTGLPTGDESAVNPGGGALFSKIDAIRVNATAVSYLIAVEDTGQLVRLNTTLVEEWAVGMSGIRDVFADAQPGVAYASLASFHRRINQDTGAILHSSSLGFADPEQTVHRSATGAFGVAIGSDAQGDTVQYFVLNEDDFTTQQSATDLTVNQFQIAAVDKATRTFTYWVDAADDVLVCGTVDNAHVFAAKVDTTQDTLVWGTMFQVDAATTTQTTLDHACQLDYGTGFYVSGFRGSPSAAFVRRYSGGDFLQHAAPDAVVLPESVAPDVFVPSDFGSGIANFAADIGFTSGPSLFFFGLVLVIIVFLVVAGATKGVTDEGVPAGIGGAIAGMGTMVFNTTQELWPAWATVVLIVLTSAVILWFTRNLFIGGGTD